MSSVVIEVVEWATGNVVHTVEVHGETDVDSRRVERTESGMLRNLDTSRFGIRAVKRAAA